MTRCRSTLPVCRVAAMIILALFTCGADTARADGALYVGLPKLGLRDGFAYGFAHSHTSEAEAKAAARKVCEDQALSVNIRAGACKLVDTFKKRCVAVAMDKTDRWAGWSLGDTKDDADKLALAECAKGAATCEVTDSVCDE